MLMSIIVALFMGLTVSAEEIIRDRKILKRESFLNLSWNSYLMSKLVILFTMSAIQTFTFVLIGNLILGIEWSMLLPFWFVLFTTSCLANVLGLNVSSAFNSAVTVYVMIPLLLIPQMILSGVLFSFDKLNDFLSTKGKVPIVADMMASRWAYEALAVYQFKNNSYEAPYFALEKLESQYDFKSSYLTEELSKKRKYIADHLTDKNDSIRAIMQKDLNIIRESIKDDYFKKGLEGINTSVEWDIKNYTPGVDAKLEAFLAGFKKYYQEAYNAVVSRREKMVFELESNKAANYDLNEYKNKYFNESLADLVQNISEKNRILEFDGQLIQQLNPIFMDPKPTWVGDYRAHFYSPEKNFFGFQMSTFLFNMIIIWLMTLVLYIALYFEWLRKAIKLFENVSFSDKVKLPKAVSSKKK